MNIDNFEMFETFVRSHFFTDKIIDSKEGENLAKIFIFISDKRGFIDSTTGETFYKIPYTELTKTIDLFHKSKNDLSLADYLYRIILNIHA